MMTASAAGPSDIATASRDSQDDKSTDETSLMEVLPDEIIEKVMMMMEPKELLTAPHVCSRWRRIAADPAMLRYWKRIVWKQYISGAVDALGRISGLDASASAGDTDGASLEMVGFFGRRGGDERTDASAAGTTMDGALDATQLEFRAWQTAWVLQKAAPQPMRFLRHPNISSIASDASTREVWYIPYGDVAHRLAQESQGVDLDLVRQSQANRCVRANQSFPPRHAVPYFPTILHQRKQPVSSASRGNLDCSRQSNVSGSCSDKDKGSKVKPVLMWLSCSYYEVTILPLDTSTRHSLQLNSQDTAAVGLGAWHFRDKGRQPGWDRNSVGYHSDDGNLFVETGFGHDFGPRAREGDTLGCGITYQGIYRKNTRPLGNQGNTPPIGAVGDAKERESGQQSNKNTSTPPSDTERERPFVFFTHNGRYLGAACEWPLEGGRLPLLGVSLRNRLRYNFGQEPFVYDLSARDWETRPSNDDDAQRVSVSDWDVYRCKRELKLALTTMEMSRVRHEVQRENWLENRYRDANEEVGDGDDDDEEDDDDDEDDVGIHIDYDIDIDGHDDAIFNLDNAQFVHTHLANELQQQLGINTDHLSLAELLDLAAQHSYDGSDDSDGASDSGDDFVTDDEETEEDLIIADDSDQEETNS